MLLKIKSLLYPLSKMCHAQHTSVATVAKFSLKVAPQKDQENLILPQPNIATLQMRLLGNLDKYRINFFQQKPSSAFSVSRKSPSLCLHSQGSLVACVFSRQKSNFLNRSRPLLEASFYRSHTQDARYSEVVASIKVNTVHELYISDFSVIQFCAFFELNFSIGNSNAQSKFYILFRDTISSLSFNTRNKAFRLGLKKLFDLGSLKFGFILDVIKIRNKC